MLDKQDSFTRWFQGILGVVLFFGAVFLFAASLGDILGRSLLLHRNGVVAAGIAVVGFYISFRCIWYAITGEDNINRDDS